MNTHEKGLRCPYHVLFWKTIDQIQQVRWAQHYGILGVVTIDNWDIRNLPGIGGGVAELGRSHIWEVTMFWENFSWNSRRVWVQSIDVRSWRSVSIWDEIQGTEGWREREGWQQKLSWVRDDLKCYFLYDDDCSLEKILNQGAKRPKLLLEAK